MLNLVRIIIILESQRKNKDRPHDTAPSIPSKNNKMLFFDEEDTEKDTETKNTDNKIKIQKATPEEGSQEVGPFSYNPDVNKVKKTNQSAGWSLSKSKRTSFKSNKDTGM